MYRNTDAGAITDNLTISDGNGRSGLTNVLKGVLVNGYSDASKPAAGWLNTFSDPGNNIEVLENGYGLNFKIDEESVYAARVEGFESMTSATEGVKGRWTDETFIWHVGRNGNTRPHDWVVIADENFFLMAVRQRLGQSDTDDLAFFGIAEIDAGLRNDTVAIFGNNTLTTQNNFTGRNALHADSDSTYMSIYNDNVTTRAVNGGLVHGSTVFGSSEGTGIQPFNDGIFYREPLIRTPELRIAGKIKNIFEPIGVWGGGNINVAGANTEEFFFYDGQDDLLGKKVCFAHGTLHTTEWSVLMVADE